MADYRLSFHPAAVNDVETAHAWYSSHNPAAGAQFLDNLDIESVAYWKARRDGREYSGSISVSSWRGFRSA